MKESIFIITFLIYSFDLFSQSKTRISTVDLNKYIGIYMPFQSKDSTLNQLILEISKKNSQYYIGFFKEREIDKETKKNLFIEKNLFKIVNSGLTLKFAMINDTSYSFLMKNQVFRKGEVNEMKYVKIVK